MSYRHIPGRFTRAKVNQALADSLKELDHGIADLVIATISASAQVRPAHRA